MDLIDNCVLGASAIQTFVQCSPEVLFRTNIVYFVMIVRKSWENFAASIGDLTKSRNDILNALEKSIASSLVELAVSEIKNNVSGRV